MNFAAEQIQVASLIFKRVQELAAAGLDDVTLFGEMKLGIVHKRIGAGHSPETSNSQIWNRCQAKM